MKIDEYLKVKSERDIQAHEDAQKISAELTDAVDALRIVGVEVDENELH